MKTILLIDNDDSFSVLVSRALTAEPYHVVRAEDGAAALALLADGLVPDVIALDVNMPIMDGVAFLELLRRDVRFGLIPVIVFTDFPAVDRFPWVSAEPKSSDFGPLIAAIERYLLR